MFQTLFRVGRTPSTVITASPARRPPASAALPGLTATIRQTSPNICITQP